MNPSVFSLKRYETTHKGWDVTETFDVDYWSSSFNKTMNATVKNKYKNYYGSKEEESKENCEGDDHLNIKAKWLYSLAFSYEWKFVEDEVYFAFSIPYSYSQVEYFLTEVIEKSEAVKSKEISYSRKILCKTLGGRNVYILRITGKAGGSSQHKKGIVVVARCHPGETVGSFVMEGVLKSLVKRGDTIGEYLMQKWVFYVVPMINPDGVFWGNSRTSLAGVDLNRRWTEPLL
jgi:hypothetical protein